MGFTTFVPSSLGWQPDLPDPRDYFPEEQAISERLPKLSCPGITSIPASMDLRRDEDGDYFTQCRDQGTLNASSAFAVLSIVEYMQRRVLGQTFCGSHRFLYETSRRDLHNGGSSSASIRTVLKALKRYGVPPEEMLPYSDQPRDSAMKDIRLLGYARDYQDLLYFRLDNVHQSTEQTLNLVRKFLASGLPIALGFTVPRSLSFEGEIPFRPAFDSYYGGQSVVAVGYDDQRFPGNQGALLIRSSWGTRWGDNGYGWLPYAFVVHGLASCFWSIVPHKQGHLSQRNKSP